MGIYALEKDGCAELRNDVCCSVTKMKEMIRQYKAQGYKVHANGR